VPQYGRDLEQDHLWVVRPGRGKYHWKGVEDGRTDMEMVILWESGEGSENENETGWSQYHAKSQMTGQGSADKKEQG